MIPTAMRWGKKPKTKQKLCKAQDTPLLKIFQTFLTSLRVWPKSFSTLYGKLTTALSLTSSSIFFLSLTVPALLFLDHTRNIPTSGLPPILSPFLESSSFMSSNHSPFDHLQGFHWISESVLESHFVSPYFHLWASAVTQWVKNLPAMQETH